MPELASVRAIATSNILLSGAQVVDSISLAAGERCAVVGQTDAAQNGVYEIRDVGWARSADFDDPAEILTGTHFKVREGGTWGGSRWYLTTTVEPVTVNSTLLNFRPESESDVIKAGGGLVKTGTTLAIADTGVAAGTYTSPTVTLNSEGRVMGVAGGSVPATLMEGLEVVYVNATAIDVFPGSLWIPGLDRVLDFPTKIRRSGLSFTAGVWHHLYAYENAGVADVEVTTVAPSAPYRGGARTRGGTTPDDSRRLIGAVYALTTTSMRRFDVLPGGFVRWVADLNTALRAGSGLTATTGTDLDVSPFVPPHAEGVTVSLTFINSDNSSVFHVSAAGDGLLTAGGTESASQLFVGAAPASPIRHNSGPIAFAGSTVLRHRQTAAGASRSGNIDIMGYYERLA